MGSMTISWWGICEVYLWWLIRIVFDNLCQKECRLWGWLSNRQMNLGNMSLSWRVLVDVVWRSWTSFSYVDGTEMICNWHFIGSFLSLSDRCEYYYYFVTQKSQFIRRVTLKSTSFPSLNFEFCSLPNTENESHIKKYSPTTTNYTQRFL